MKVKIELIKLPHDGSNGCVIYIGEKHTAFKICNGQLKDLQFFFDFLLAPSIEALLDEIIGPRTQTDVATIKE